MIKFNRLPLLTLIGALTITTACDDDSVDTPSVEAPATYAFTRDGASTVSFSGQTARIKMGAELNDELLNLENFTEENLLEMFRNETAAGGDANPFSDADLNAETKSIKSKVAASADLFASNTAEQATIRADFESWISKQVTEIGPNRNTLAEAGVAGQIAEGATPRYVSAEGLEYNQAVIKGLIGALVADQMLNHYLSTAVLDAGTNVADNDAGTLDGSNNYTTMEHKWDEAYGYAYGTSANTADPNATIGADDDFLNKYIGRVEGDPDFAGIAADIFDAFKLGRAAIVAKNYTVRDEQAAIIRKKVSEIIGIRAVYYLQQAKSGIANSEMGAALHDLSEGYGFIYSLRFTHNPDTGAPYFTKAEVDALIDQLMGDGANGLWDVTGTTLDAMSATIADKFDFTITQAASTN
ncbi:MAG: DUF4856 domain-containing protein [Flammeovirgaceae bacterium]